MEDEKIFNDDSFQPIQKEIPALDRDQAILEYLCGEGYSQTSMIHKEILMDVSIQTTRRILRNLADHQLIGYKELPTRHSEGPGERVFFLMEDGLKILGKSDYEISEYIKNIQRIRINTMRHYLKAREIEKLFLKSIGKAGYDAISYNEFSEASKLHLQMKQNGGCINLRSDGQITVKKRGAECITLKLEIDRGTEGFQAIVRKMDTYALFFKSSLIHTHAATFPIYIVFAGGETRIQNLSNILRNHPLAASILFLPVERLEQHDLFQNNAFWTCQGKKISLASLMAYRDPILSFIHAMETASKNLPSYEIAARASVTHCNDPFFPIPIEVEGKSIFWAPDGYLSIKKQSQGHVWELLFAMVAIIRDEMGEKLLEKMLPYEIFLGQKEYRTRVTSIQESYGCLVVVNHTEKMKHALTMLKNSRISERIRVIEKENCVAEKILAHPVWRTVDGNLIQLFPA